MKCPVRRIRIQMLYVQLDCSFSLRGKMIWSNIPYQSPLFLVFTWIQHCPTIGSKPVFCTCAKNSLVHFLQKAVPFFVLLKTLCWTLGSTDSGPLTVKNQPIWTHLIHCINATFLPKWLKSNTQFQMTYITQHSIKVVPTYPESLFCCILLVVLQMCLYLLNIIQKTSIKVIP